LPFDVYAYTFLMCTSKVYLLTYIVTYKGRELVVANLVRHVERYSSLEHRHGGVRVTTQRCDVHQRATVICPTRDVRMKLLNE